MADGGGGDLGGSATMIIGALAAIGAIASAIVVGYQQYLTRWQLKSTLFDRRFENFKAIDSLIREEHRSILGCEPRENAAPRPEFYEEFSSERMKTKFLFGQKAFNTIADVENIMSKLGAHVRSEAFIDGRRGANLTQAANFEIEEIRRKFTEVVEPEISQYLTSPRIKSRPVYLISPFL